MADPKNTHVAVHAVQSRDPKTRGMTEVAPGTEFIPAEDQVEYLERVGAIKRIEKKAKVAEEKGEDAGSRLVGRNK